jgi:hypothetical protein
MRAGHHWQGGKRENHRGSQTIDLPLAFVMRPNGKGRITTIAWKLDQHEKGWRKPCGPVGQDAVMDEGRTSLAGREKRQSP